MRKPALLISKSNAQISCAVTKQLISIFVLATLPHLPDYRKIKFKATPLVVHPGFMSGNAGNPEERFSSDIE